MTSPLAGAAELLDPESVEVSTFRGRHLDGARERVFSGPVAARDPWPGRVSSCRREP